MFFFSLFNCNSGIFCQISPVLPDYQYANEKKMLLSKKHTKQVEIVNARSVDIWHLSMADYGRLWNSNNFL